MNFRRNHGRNQRTGGKLEVKEVILPVKSDQKNACSSGGGSRNQEDNECRHNITGNSLKLGEHEIAAFCGLVVLNKPPVEDYVLGTRKKKYKKKKTKQNRYYPKDNSTFCNLFLETNETLHSEVENAKGLSRTAEAFEENQNIERKIQKYEKWVELQQEENYRRQRHLEKQSLEKQENLAETWLGFIQRRKELKEKNLEQSEPIVSNKKDQYNRPIDISLIPKKYWNDKTDKRGLEKPKKSQNRIEKDVQKSLPVALDELKDEFFEKLIFFDVSDDDLC